MDKMNSQRFCHVYQNNLYYSEHGKYNDELYLNIKDGLFKTIAQNGNLLFDFDQNSTYEV